MSTVPAINRKEISGKAPVEIFSLGEVSAPGSVAGEEPRLEFYPTLRRDRPTSAVIVVPGGGYEFLADEHEGRNVAEWFRVRNIPAFVLYYRLPAQGHRHPAPLQDVQRAVRLVRGRAADWNIDPGQIAVIGFSAGGHLVTTLATHFDGGEPSAPDAAGRVSCRPDFVAAIYPVVTLRTPGVTHEGSKLNLLGPSPDPALVEDLSNETGVTAATPPMVLVHAADDDVVPIENSRLMLESLRAAGVRSELHEYPRGGHGFGLTEDPHAPPGWLDRVLAWLRDAGFDPALADCPSTNT